MLLIIFNLQSIIFLCDSWNNTFLRYYKDWIIILSAWEGQNYSPENAEEHIEI